MNAEVDRLLALVAEIPLASRAEFLERQCSDLQVRAEVESLLPFYTDSESWFDHSVHEIARSVRRIPELSPGDLAGSYRILSLIGIGGMGAVYLAERVDGAFHQEVAIKVVPSANAAFLLERFERERHILALLDHPYIARILDGGEGPNGLPYFAMEYVAGETIDVFCEQRALPLRERLRLFLKVCEAVSHAHSRLVVHRDLKPANVLVTAAGEPKLLDFGIAKVLDPSHEKTPSTGLLTPDYASPEQVRGEAITVTGDVYSLGALLYKMLTGCPPHRLESKSPLESARIISECAAPPASSVSPGIPSDVSAILQKALHNDPTRRYAGVADLSSDIQRFLDQRPVLAAPDTFLYRARRFFRRNALVSAISAAAVIFLLAGSAVALYQGRRAQRRFDQVRQLAHVFLFDFDRSIRDVAGTLEARKLIASTAQRYLRQLQAESAGDPQLEREIAESYQLLGDIQAQLAGEAERDSGIASTREAYDIRKRLGDAQSADAGRRRDFIQLVSTLASRCAQSSNDAHDADVWATEAVRLAQSWVAAAPRSSQALEAARTAFMNEGRRLEFAGHSERAVKYMDRGIGFGELAHRGNLQSLPESIDLARAQSLLGDTLIFLKRGPEAVPHAQRGLAVLDEVAGGGSRNQRWRRVHCLTLSTAGLAYEQVAEKDPSQLPLALDYLKRANQEASSMAQDDPKSTLAKDDLATQDNRYAYALRLAGRDNEAAALYRKASAAARDLALTVPDNRRNWYMWAIDRVEYGALRLESRHAAAAQSIFESADLPIRRGLELNPRDATILEVRASQLAGLAQAARTLGNQVDARHKIRQCVDVVSDMIQRDPSVKSYITKYDKILALAKRLDVQTELR